MNAHVDFRTGRQNILLQMVAQHIVKQQAHQHWSDVVGGCDDCSTVPVDATAGGRRRRLVMGPQRLMMQDIG